MMFLIQHFNGQEIEHEWYADRPKPAFKTCIEVQADGVELETIRRQFRNIPMSSGPVVRWKGEWAQFIYDNIVAKYL